MIATTVDAATVDAGDSVPLTVPALLRQQAERHGSRVLLACDDDVLTYDAAERRSRALARGLLAVGVGKGTQVGLLYPNGSEFVVGWLAAARVGAVTVPLSTFSTSAELRTLLRGADVGVLLAARSYRDHDYAAALAEAVPELATAMATAPATASDAASGAVSAPPLFAASMPVLRHVFFGATADAREATGAAVVSADGGGAGPAWTVPALLARGREVGEDVAQAAEEAVYASDRLVIVHTSGSTSAPKGVIHTHGALIRHLVNLNEIRRYTADDVLFSNSPFFWIGGFAYALLGTLLAGGRLVCSNAVDAAAALDVLERERPTMVNGYAQSVAALAADPSFARRDLSSIRRGNLYSIMPDDVRPADPQLRHQMLGMTETGSVCLVSEDEGDQPEHRRGSFGRPAPGFEARVVDPDDGRVLGPGEVGELWLRGPFLMEGYYGRERHEVFDADGWYHSGDLFVVDDDGFFYFKGRGGDVIKTGGANVSPVEVEATIRDVTGLTAHVVGIEDAARGQLVAAAVRVPTGHSVDADGLRRQLAERLSAYKVPRRIVLLADHEVPTMSSGKIDVPALKELLRAAG
ncbi:acyl--CoA ligase [Frankia sp. CNm7]|uniref:Acyl--CoA ligase n=1 Tax=Frankia nepalensis TaxID=1836974 RepID=A0A937UMI7_9ACTN|nr:class I adenylate-forming enzyme family protein [Frankia nepalensis]MBL7497191.1 acyl--CoA ligase [Frankia nepalensis]MBL7515089.1 acyl--CoA ligase [Frankia nepalensis]MBL7522294.1 acyl--CoA ligase [Frankia nepalensis]MBL7626897.1 acyl--CoA ligase [Frankia nepalensis]